MIAGIGVDLVNISRINAGLLRFGDRFAEKILSQAEYDDFKTSKKPASFLAKRFAAKEAMAKALGTGFRDSLTLKQITVDNNSIGKPVLVCTDRALYLLEQKNINSIHVSISDETDNAIAMVVLEQI